MAIEQNDLQAGRPGLFAKFVGKLVGDLSFERRVEQTIYHPKARYVVRNFNYTRESLRLGDINRRVAEWGIPLPPTLDQVNPETL